MDKQTTVINLWGGPGIGKSTLAAELFACLKRQNVSVELVREYVKNWAWRGERVGPWDDVYLFGKQVRAESTLYGRVSYIVTDSPIPLGAVYERMYSPGSSFMLDLARSWRQRQAKTGIRNVDILLRRDKPYSCAGRYETEEQARQVDDICRAVIGLACDGAMIESPANPDVVLGALRNCGILP